MSRTLIVIMVPLFAVAVGLPATPSDGECTAAEDAHTGCCCVGASTAETNAAPCCSDAQSHGAQPRPSGTGGCRCGVTPTLPYPIFQDATLTFDVLLLTTQDCPRHVVSRTDAPLSPPPKGIN